MHAQQPNRPIDLPGMHAYAEKSVAAGETIHFHISASVPCTISVISPAHLDRPVPEDITLPGSSSDPGHPIQGQQPVRPGSYVNIGGPALPESFTRLTFECWIRPWQAPPDLPSFPPWQGLITQHDYPGDCGFAFCITASGQLALYLGNAPAFDPARLAVGPRVMPNNPAEPQRKWYHTVAVWNGDIVAPEPNVWFWLDGRQYPADINVAARVSGAVNAPLRLGAYGVQGLTDSFFDGDLAMPALYARALSNEEVMARFAQRTAAPNYVQPPEATPDLLGCWPLREERGTQVADVGVNVPWPIAAPYVIYFGPDYSHLTRAERATHRWLTDHGYGYDVATDFDLFRDPTLLQGYQTLIINGHSEYWTAQAYQSVQSFLDNGGKLVVLSGNTMFWRVSFNPDATVMECRKEEITGVGMPGCSRGEAWHSDDGQRGSLMRFCGYPAWRLIGMESVGFWVAGRQLGLYTRTPPEPTEPLALFDGLGVNPGDPIGQAVGHEFDVRLDLPQQNLEVVARDVVPPIGPVTLAESYAVAGSDLVWDYGVVTRIPIVRHDPIDRETTRAGQVIYWNRDGGGAVFHAGSIGAGQGLFLQHNRVWGGLLADVLTLFGV